MHKDIEKILYSEKDIENIVNTIAKQIEKSRLTFLIRSTIKATLPLSRPTIIKSLSL